MSPVGSPRECLALRNSYYFTYTQIPLSRPDPFFQFPLSFICTDVYIHGSVPPLRKRKRFKVKKVDILTVITYNHVIRETLKTTTRNFFVCVSLFFTSPHPEV